MGKRETVGVSHPLGSEDSVYCADTAFYAVFF